MTRRAEKEPKGQGDEEKKGGKGKEEGKDEEGTEKMASWTH